MSKSLPEHEFPRSALLTEGLGAYASDTDLSFYSGATSICHARSTLVEALALPEKTTIFTSCYFTTVFDAKTRSKARLTNPTCLPQGHPTIALHSEQMQSILRVIADGSARAADAMIEDIIERTSRLNIGSSQPRQEACSTFSGPESCYPDV